MRNDAGVWIREGYKLFAEKGIEGVKVVALSKRVGISKSSFYYFYENSETFFEELIEHWVKEYTARAFEVSELEKNPRNKYCSWAYLSLKDSTADSFYAQLLLLPDKGDYLLRRMDYTRKLREEYFTSLLLEAGFDTNLIKEKFEILFSLNYGWTHRSMHRPMSDIEKMQELSEIWDSIIALLDKFSH